MEWICRKIWRIYAKLNYNLHVGLLWQCLIHWFSKLLKNIWALEIMKSIEAQRKLNYSLAPKMFEFYYHRLIINPFITQLMLEFIAHWLLIIVPLSARWTGALNSCEKRKVWSVNLSNLPTSQYFRISFFDLNHFLKISLRISIDCLKQSRKMNATYMNILWVQSRSFDEDSFCSATMTFSRSYDSK